MSAAMDALLDIEHLTVRFGASTVVDEVSFAIAAGEKFALVGESGSGKSITALSVLRLVDGAATSGRISFGGEELTAKSEEQMQALRGSRIGMIFQEPMTALNPLFTIGNQIGEVLEMHLSLGPAEARTRAIELLARTGVPEPGRRIDSYPHELSGGQRQRAMIAMALACKPQLLICDEPTTALDVTIQAQILALLDELQAEMGMALLFITHDLNLVRRFTHRVGVMERGKLVECGATAEVFARPQHAYTQEAARQPAAARRAARWPQMRRYWCKAAIAGRQLSDRQAGWFKTARHFEAVQADATLSAAGAAKRWASSASRAPARPRSGWRCWRCNRSASGEVQIWAASASTTRDREQPSAPHAPAHAGGIPGPVSHRSVAAHDGGSDRLAKALALHRDGIDRKPGREQLVLEMLAEVGLSERHGVANVLQRYPHEFSAAASASASRSRAAVVLRPEVLVLDEPTSALDVSVQQQVLQLCSRPSCSSATA